MSTPDLPIGSGLPAMAPGPLPQPVRGVGQSPTQPAQRSIMDTLAPMLPGLLATAQQKLAQSSDAELDALCDRAASMDPWLARRLAFRLLGATVRKIGGFSPTEVRATARIPDASLELHPHRDGWVAITPTRST